MLIEIYRAMLAAASNWPVPPNIELGFTFNEEETKAFWSGNHKEKELLLEEWESSSIQSRYTKVLYGRKFYIQFTYKTKVNAS